jgi:hypothetical protein
MALTVLQIDRPWRARGTLAVVAIVTGAALAAVPRASAAGGVGSQWAEAYQSYTHSLGLSTSDFGDHPNLASMPAGTSPAIAVVPTGGYQIAYVNSTGDLATTGAYGSTLPFDNGRVMPGTSPAITVTGSGYEIAFQDSDGQLITTGTDGTDGWGSMDPKSSPSIIGATGGYEAIFESSTDMLWSGGTLGSGSLGATMAPGTSPSVSAPPVGDPGALMIAWQGRNNHLWITGSHPTDTTKPMALTASPSLTELVGSGYEIAYRSGDNNLSLYGTAATTDTSEPMQLNTDPSIVGLSETPYLVVYQNGSGFLSAFSQNGNSPTTTQMDPKTSPSIAPFITP